MQKLITCFSVLLLVTTCIKAQNLLAPAKKEITITSVGNPEKKFTLISSDFIAVHNGDKIALQPNLLKAPKQHLFLKGALKSAGSFIIVQQVNKTINNSNNKADNNASTKTNVLPAIGFGVATGMPNIIQGLKSKKAYLIYSLYDNDKNLLSAQKIKLNKQNNSITFNNISTDGFARVLMTAKRNNVFKGDLTITIEEAGINGGIAETFNLNSFGDCQGGEGGPICACLAGCNLTASNCYDDADGPYFIRLLFCAALPPFLAIPCVNAATQIWTAATNKCDKDLDDCEKYCKQTYPNCK